MQNDTEAGEGPNQLGSTKNSRAVHAYSQARKHCPDTLSVPPLAKHSLTAFYRHTSAKRDDDACRCAM